VDADEEGRMDEKAGDPPGWGPGAKIDGITIDHSSRECGFYFQRGVLVVPDEALEELLAALGGLGDAARRVRVEPIEGTGITQVRIPLRRPTDLLIDELGGSLPVEPGYIAISAPHIKGLAAGRPASVRPDKIPTEPRYGIGANVNIGVVDLGFFSPEKAGHPDWAIDKVVLDAEMPLPDPTQPQYPYVGHGNAIVGIIKQLAPEATVYTGTIQSSGGDAPGGTSDRRLGEAIQRLLSRHRVHILVIPFGGSTRHGLMPVTERVLEPHVGSTLILASAGNDGIDPTIYPAADPDVVGTGAWRRNTRRLGWLDEVCATVISPHTALGKYRLAEWSNQGIAAQLGAPGVAVPAPFIKGRLNIGPGSLDPAGSKWIRFDGWGLFTGTSFSVAVAAGCIAGAVSGKCAPSPEHLAAAATR
jgi:hypothetical protein